MFKKLDAPTENAFTIDLDGLPVQVEPSESVAAVILRQSDTSSRTSPVSGSRRGPYCMMGVCFDCLAVVNGELVQTCLMPVKAGMKVRRQMGPRSVGL